MTLEPLLNERRLIDGVWHVWCGGGWIAQCYADNVVWHIQVTSQEHYDLIAMFDRLFKGRRLDKETKDMWPRGHVYQNGEVNELFLAFREGVAYGRRPR